MPLELRDLVRDYSQTAHLTNFNFQKHHYFDPGVKSANQLAAKLNRIKSQKEEDNESVNDYAELKTITKGISDQDQHEARVGLKITRQGYTKYKVREHLKRFKELILDDSCCLHSALTHSLDVPSTTIQCEEAERFDEQSSREEIETAQLIIDDRKFIKYLTATAMDESLGIPSLMRKSKYSPRLHRPIVKEEVPIPSLKV
ncbi:hypothetical protein FGO68_gene3369 [Halteria grandinella]|uniref:Uncharacterized protein n=1 Tax=Halteria grandinella TaxID=5974 RepID=A0A8J8P3D6_HALGN|nr:hypothetical protein FGO68_gene3369 [Halteria grandinella]